MHLRPHEARIAALAPARRGSEGASEWIWIWSRSALRVSSERDPHTQLRVARPTHARIVALPAVAVAAVVAVAAAAAVAVAVAAVTEAAGGGRGSGGS